MVRAEVAALGLANVEVDGFNALLVKWAEKQGATRDRSAACARWRISSTNSRWRG